jgi:hypothetical protein
MGNNVKKAIFAIGVIVLFLTMSASAMATTSIKTEDPIFEILIAPGFFRGFPYIRVKNVGSETATNVIIEEITIKPCSEGRGIIIYNPNRPPILFGNMDPGDRHGSQPIMYLLKIGRRGPLVFRLTVNVSCDQGSTASASAWGIMYFLFRGYCYGNI